MTISFPKGRGYALVKPEDGEPTPTLYLYDIFGVDLLGGIAARQIVADLQAMGPVPELAVRINSPGGDVFEGVAVYNALVRFRIDKRGATQYWVVGGEYADTSFRRLVEGAAEKRVGPFDSYDEARKQWAALSMAQVDNALVRFRIDKV